MHPADPSWRLEQPRGLHCCAAGDWSLALRGGRDLRESQMRFTEPRRLEPRGLLCCAAGDWNLALRGGRDLRESPMCFTDPWLIEQPR